MVYRTYYSVITIFLLVAGCQARQPVQPTAAPTVVPLSTLVRAAMVITPPTAAPPAPTVAPPIINAAPTVIAGTVIQPVQPTMSAIPAKTIKNDPKAIQLDGMVANLRDNQVMFIVYVTSRSAPLITALVTWTFESSKQSTQKQAAIPSPVIGESSPIYAAMPLEEMPQQESTLTYRWTLTDGDGNTLTSSVGRFKLTEATRADQRDDLPIISADVKFESFFPDHAQFTVSLMPQYPITNARFFVTQNHGILVSDYEAHVPTKNSGQPVTISFSWNATLSLQIPWQQFETWWVFTDEYGHIWRTKHAFNDYADDHGHRWVRTPTKYAVLYTYEQSTANISLLATATDQSVEALQKAFKYKLLYQPHIVIYNDIADFKEWAPPVVEGSFIGMASGLWGGAVIGVYNSMRFTGYSIIKHELTHVFQFQSMVQTLPEWFVEGSARYMEELPEENDEAVTRQVCKQYGPPSLQASVPSISPDRKVHAWPYYVGMTFIKYMRTTYGNDSFAKVYLALARNVDLPTALKAATGKTMAELDQGWQKWIVR